MWHGFITLLQFPDLARAKAWYDSAEYRTVRDLRTNSSTPTDLIVEGVADGHRSADLIDIFGLGA